jgi:hypothetical protein
MKRNVLFRLALVTMTVGAMRTAEAGSAVVWDGGSHVVYSYGHPVEIAKKRALEMASAKDWVNVRIVAASDINGYGAIAVALHPNGRGSLIGISLGNRSATEANTLAIAQCLKAGGTKATVKSKFRG